jgi:hypothetical protein
MRAHGEFVEVFDFFLAEYRKLGKNKRKYLCFRKTFNDYSTVSKYA